MATLFDPVTVGDLKLANRIVMAPLTRNRSPALCQTTSTSPIMNSAQVLVSSSPRQRRSAIRGRAMPMCRAFIRTSSLQAGSASPTLFTAQAARSSCRCGMWAVFRTTACSQMAASRLRLRPSRPSRRPISCIRMAPANLHQPQSHARLKERASGDRCDLCQGCKGCG